MEVTRPLTHSMVLHDLTRIVTPSTVHVLPSINVADDESIVRMYSGCHFTMPFMNDASLEAALTPLARALSSWKRRKPSMYWTCSVRNRTQRSYVVIAGDAVGAVFFAVFIEKQPKPWTGIFGGWGSRWTSTFI